MNTTKTKIQLSLTTDTKFRLLAPVNGNGGFQYLLRAVQAGVATRGNQLSLDPEVASRILRAAKTANGAGGFQGRLAPIATALTELKRSLNQR